MNCFNNAFGSKNVLITGHTGFKGSWLALWLKELGANVIGYSLDPYTEEDNFVVGRLNEKIIDIRGDIRDFHTLKSVFIKYKPEIVFHLAAQPLVRLSYDIPRETYETNVMGTLNVLECIRYSDSTKVGVMITTDKCYENKEQIWGYRETDAMGGYDPYSSSKGCAEILISSYRSSYFNSDKFNQHGKAIASVRAGNVIGGGDWSKDRIIPDCIRALKENKSIDIRSPLSVRPWQHVLEPLSGYLLVAAKMLEDGNQYASSWNFGPDYESIVPVKRVADLVLKYWGSGKWNDLSVHNATTLHEATLLALDCTKAKYSLNWSPVFDIETAIKTTVDWYKNYDKTDPYEICRGQINNYVQSAFKKGMDWAVL